MDDILVGVTSKLCNEIMASFPMRCCLQNIGYDLKEGTRIPASSVFFPSQSRDPTEKNEHKVTGKTRLPVLRYLGGTVKKLSKGLKENLSPKQKGDWKDLLLMSISFAVYVYISQMIVSAYCVWMSSLKQHW